MGTDEDRNQHAKMHTARIKMKQRILMSTRPLRWEVLCDCPICDAPEPKMFEARGAWFVVCKCTYEIGPYANKREALIDWNNHNFFE